MTSSSNTESSIPLFAQMLSANPSVPIEGFGPNTDQIATDVAFSKAGYGHVDEDGAMGNFSLEIGLVPHNIRCEPPRGYNR